jgi:hypothetical protein
MTVKSRFFKKSFILVPQPGPGGPGVPALCVSTGFHGLPLFIWLMHAGLMDKQK